MHSPSASFAFRELRRQELLSESEHDRLVDLACADDRCARPYEELALVVQAVVHHLTAFSSLALRRRPGAMASPTTSDAPSSPVTS